MSELTDTRESLEEVAYSISAKYCGDSYNYHDCACAIICLLDRQAAITERETRKCRHYHADKHYCDIHETRINALNERIDELTRKLEDFEGDCYCGATVVEWHELACKLQDRVDELQAALNAKEQLERDSAYMRLPVDADGVPIKPGDRVYGYGRKEDGMTVRFLDQHGNLMVGDTGTTSLYECLYWTAENVTHHKPDTVESLLADFQQDTLTSQGEYVGEIIDAEEWERELGKSIEEYAERIKKAVEHG